MATVRGALYSNKTATGAVKSERGQIFGVIVNSHTSGTMKLWDNTSAAGSVIVNTYTFPSGSSVISFPEPVNFNTGLFLTLGGTADITFVYN